MLFCIFVGYLRNVACQVGCHERLLVHVFCEITLLWHFRWKYYNFGLSWDVQYLVLGCSVRYMWLTMLEIASHLRWPLLCIILKDYFYFGLACVMWEHHDLACEVTIILHYHVILLLFLLVMWPFGARMSVRGFIVCNTAAGVF